MSVRQVFWQWPPLMLLFFLLFVVLASPSKADEIQILLSLKSHLKESNTGVFISWTEGNYVCDFTGIVCNSNGLVSEINLPQQNLVGVVPFDSICGLQSLEKIDLGGNSLYGGITAGLKNCTRLQVLNLGLNSFSGEVPELSSLHNLNFLNLNNSGVSGTFPWKSVQNLTSLAFLSLGDNPFDSTPFPVEVLKLEKLYWLYLTNCSMRGEIPDGIQNLTLLENLELSDNQMSGEIPSAIGKLKKLRQLELYNNSFTGKLPVGLRNLTSLKNFDVSQNRLEGDLSELRFLNQLKSLHLFENHFSGEIPVEFGDFKNLIELSLYRNQITGSLPQKIGSWTGFEYIDVSENFLTGTIPPDMCKNGMMTDLLVLQNKLTGTIPESYANCKSLNRLRVNNNSLSGSVPPGIWGLPNLSVMDLSMNQFEGPVTGDIAGTLVLLISLACYLFVKLKQNIPENSLKKNSWDMKSFRVLCFSEKEIIDAVKPENLIGKGGSGNVYKVVLNNGKELAVKHIWPSNSIDRKNCRTSSAMLTNRTFRSSEYVAEVATLSAVRHVNVVKLKMKSKETLLDVVDSTISEASKEDALKILTIAMHCTTKIPALRPSMRMVVQMLEEAAPLDLAAKGFGSKFFTSNTCSSSPVLPLISSPSFSSSLQFHHNFTLSGLFLSLSVEFCKCSTGGLLIFSSGIGRKNLVIHAQNIGYNSEPSLIDVMESEKELPQVNKNLYPHIEPYSSGFLKVSDIHTIYWEQSGNPNGHPVVFLHGGPGGGTAPSNRRFFDPEFYRIVLFDQRGAGKSTPHACLVENTTWDLISDIEKLRQHLEIPEWQVFGGSWGSTLSLAYSQSHPDKVTGMVLRGIFLLRKKEIDWFYEGGAAAIYPDGTPHTILWYFWMIVVNPGYVASCFTLYLDFGCKKALELWTVLPCTAWEPFRDLIPENERGSFVDAYSKRLNCDDKEIQSLVDALSKQEAQLVENYAVILPLVLKAKVKTRVMETSQDLSFKFAAARAWTKWEMMTAHLLPNEDNIKKGDDDYFFIEEDKRKVSKANAAFARIENHYFVNKGFFPSDSFLLDNVDKIRHINTTIVQGRYDVCCPMMSAWDLHKAWPEAELKVVPDAGHSANEPGIAAELVAANENLKNIIKNGQ
ncbi:hypothetical protein Patl1_37258 [Pistacia atlantica]|nr:hypothetical protein Patl1_37258 [Pistacia atlantica]